MNTFTITTLSIATASLAALRPALQDAKAYGKVARYNVDAMREYAAKAAEVRAAGNIEELTADNVDAVLAQVRADKAPAPKAPKAEGATVAATEADRQPRAATVAKLAQAIEAGTVQKDGSVEVNVEGFEAAGLGAQWTRWPAQGWTAGMPARAAAACGYTGSSAKGVTTFRKA